MSVKKISLCLCLVAVMLSAAGCVPVRQHGVVPDDAEPVAQASREPVPEPEPPSEENDVSWEAYLDEMLEWSAASNG